MFIHQVSNTSQLYKCRRVLRGANVHRPGSDNKQTRLTQILYHHNVYWGLYLFTYFPYRS